MPLALELKKKWQRGPTVTPSERQLSEIIVFTSVLVQHSHDPAHMLTNNFHFTFLERHKHKVHMQLTENLFPGCLVSSSLYLILLEFVLLR